MQTNHMEVLDLVERCANNSSLQSKLGINYILHDTVVEENRYGFHFIGRWDTYKITTGTIKSFEPPGFFKTSHHTFLVVFKDPKDYGRCSIRLNEGRANKARLHPSHPQ